MVLFLFLPKERLAFPLCQKSRAGDFQYSPRQRSNKFGIVSFGLTKTSNYCGIRRTFTPSLTNRWLMLKPVRFWVCLVLILGMPRVFFAQDKTPYRLVNPFIGTGNEGNCFPGAQAPFGMLSLSPDNTFDNYEDAASRPGYKYFRNEINGFGLTHYSGVGCHAMQDLQFMPVAGTLDKSPVNDKHAYVSRFSHEREKAMPGYYSVTLDDYHVDAKFAATVHAAIGEITYRGDQEAHLVFAPTNCANGIGDGELHIESTAMTVTGWVSTGGFCWRDPKDRPYRVFFVAKFNTKFSSYGVWKGKAKAEGTSNVAGDDVGAYVSFGKLNGKAVKMKVAISYVSIDNARKNLQEEISCWEFEDVCRATKSQWERMLSRLTVEGGSESQRQAFYTAVYHNLLHPNVYSDVNGDYMGFDDKVHRVANGRKQYANFSLWDTYRTTATLQALIAPDEASDMAQSLLLDAEQGGAYPNWSMNNVEYGVMNGYSTFPFIANLYAFGARNFDLQATKEMMKRVSVKHIKCKGFHGWEHVEDYMAYGYVPVDRHGHGASMTLEYAIDDFSIAQICKAAGDEAAYNYYMNRSQSFEKLFDEETRLIRPRNADGSFLTPFAPNMEKGFNEGNAMQYFWSVPHNVDALTDFCGGKGAMEKRLDTFTSQVKCGWAPDVPYYWLGNEPCFGSVYVYNFLGKAWKSQRMVRNVLNRFNDTPNGLPGDDDAGAMSALYVFSAMGLYPYIPGIGGFVVTGPLFTKVQLQLKGGKTLTLIGENAGNDAPYIQRLQVDGRETTSTWLDWNKLKHGARLNFVMGKGPNKQWGATEKDVPPSYY